LNFIKLTLIDYNSLRISKIKKISILENNNKINFYMGIYFITQKSWKNDFNQ